MVRRARAVGDCCVHSPSFRTSLVVRNGERKAANHAEHRLATRPRNLDLLPFAADLGAAPSCAGTCRMIDHWRRRKAVKS